MDITHVRSLRYNPGNTLVLQWERGKLVCVERPADMRRVTQIVHDTDPDTERVFAKRARRKKMPLGAYLKWLGRSEAAKLRQEPLPPGTPIEAADYKRMKGTAAATGRTMPDVLDVNGIRGNVHILPSGK